MIQRARAVDALGCVEREIETRLDNVEFRVPRLELHRLETEERTIEPHGFVKPRRVQRNMNFHDRIPFRAETGTRLLRVQHSV